MYANRAPAATISGVLKAIANEFSIEVSDALVDLQIENQQPKQKGQDAFAISRPDGPHGSIGPYSVNVKEMKA